MDCNVQKCGLDKKRIKREYIFMVKEPGKLVGIARMAAESTPLLRKRRTRYFSIEVKSVLNRCSNPEMPFYWTINPYRGCEFGCKYCYARYTHEYMGREDAGQFESEIYAKRNGDAVLERDLLSAKLRDRPIAIGTATDPYQPAERRFRLTRAILRRLAEWRGLRISLTTKSDLILRDLELWREIASRNEVHLNITLTTLSSELARALEPRASTPGRRLFALKALSQAGLSVGVLVMPVLPWITDGPADLEALVRGVKRRGASYLASRVLFVTASIEKVWAPFLRERFPALVPVYRGLYRPPRARLESYRRRVSDLIRQLCDKYELGRKPPSGGPLLEPGLWRQTVLPLGWSDPVGPDGAAPPLPPQPKAPPG